MLRSDKQCCGSVVASNAYIFRHHVFTETACPDVCIFMSYLFYDYYLQCLDVCICLTLFLLAMASAHCYDMV